jgi:uncharacterized protein (TIGR01777 family)
MTPRTIIFPGGAGYLGRHLADYFTSQDYNIIILTRHSQSDTPRIRHLIWDGRTIGPWAAHFDNAHAVINLAGRSVNCRYTARHKKEIYDSRLQSTAVIGEAIAAANNPPETWINASSATIYRDAYDRPMDEATGEPGQGFSVDVCQKWEAALQAAPTPSTRKVALRSAMVFGPGHGGVFEAFHRIVKLGLGGTLGRGDQYVSWIHLHDFCRAVHFILDNPTLSGPVNVSSPNPIPNKQFMRTLRQAAHKKIGHPATKWMLEIGAFVLRTETELLLKSRRVIPTKLQAAGFHFDFPDLKPALEQILKHERET